MTAAAPTQPDATDELLAVFDDADYPSPGPQVAYCWPQNPENVLVLIGGGNGSEEWGAIGDLRRREDYTIDVSVIVAVPGDSAIEAKSRAWEVWTVMAQALRVAAQNRSTLSAIQWHTFGATEWTPTVEDEGYGHVIRGGVTFAATT